MTCKSVYKYICENLDAPANSARCRAIRKHIESCPECGAYLDSLKKTITLYRDEDGPRVPPAAHKKLFKMIDLAIAGSKGPGTFPPPTPRRRNSVRK